jgi:hypothetical protein
MSITEPPASVTAMLPAIPFGVLMLHHRQGGGAAARYGHPAERQARRRETGFFDVDRGTAS